MFQLNEEDTEGVDDAEDYAIDHEGADHHQPGLASQIIRSKSDKKKKLEDSSCQSNFRSTLPLQLKRFLYKIYLIVLFKP